MPIVSTVSDFGRRRRENRNAPSRRTNNQAVQEEATLRLHPAVMIPSAIACPVVVPFPNQGDLLRVESSHVCGSIDMTVVNSVCVERHNVRFHRFYSFEFRKFIGNFHRTLFITRKTSSAFFGGGIYPILFQPQTSDLRPLVIL